MPAALAIAACGNSPAKLIELGQRGLDRHLREYKVGHQIRTIDKLLAWAAQVVRDRMEAVLNQAHSFSPLPGRCGTSP